MLEVSNDIEVKLSGKENSSLYKKAIGRYTELCHMLSSDNSEMCRVMNHVEKIIAHYRVGDQLNYSVHKVASKETEGIKTACTKPNIHAYKQKRKLQLMNL